MESLRAAAERNSESISALQDTLAGDALYTDALDDSSNSVSEVVGLQMNADGSVDLYVLPGYPGS